MSLKVEAAANKNLGGDRQLFPPNYLLLQTSVGIVTGMRIFINTCALVTSIQKPIQCEGCFIHQQHSAEKGWRRCILLQ
jgi:hypothetical protein